MSKNTINFAIIIFLNISKLSVHFTVTRHFIEKIFTSMFLSLLYDLEFFVSHFQVDLTLDLMERHLRKNLFFFFGVHLLPEKYLNSPFLLQWQTLPCCLCFFDYCWIQSVAVISLVSLILTHQFQLPQSPPLLFPPQLVRQRPNLMHSHHFSFF